MGALTREYRDVCYPFPPRFREYIYLVDHLLISCKHNGDLRGHILRLHALCCIYL